MPVLRVSVIAEVDGVPLPGFPVTRRMTLTQGETIDYQKAADNNGTTFTAIPGDAVSLPAAVQALILRPDKAVAVRLNNQSDAGITVNPQGLLVAVDVSIGSAAGTKVKVNNPDATVAATVKGYVAGS